MKTKFILSAFMIVSLSTIAQLQTPPVVTNEPVIDGEDMIYMKVDEMAQFPGGMQAMNQFLAQNLVYPQSAIQGDIEGKCYVKFVVNEEGEISDPKILKGVPGCKECDEEVLRVVSEMPKWKPATYQGQIVNSYYNLPVVFKLTGKKKKR